MRWLLLGVAWADEPPAEPAPSAPAAEDPVPARVPLERNPVIVLPRDEPTEEEIRALVKAFREDFCPTCGRG